MTQEQIEQWARDAAYFDGGANSWVAPSPEMLERFAALVAAHERGQCTRLCAEAYQVVGSLLSDLGQFDTAHAEKILDNLSQAKIVHDDVLPWPSFERAEATPSR